MFTKLSRKIGFTETELKVVLFMAAVLITGFIYKEFFRQNANQQYLNFDYSEQDSLYEFYSRSGTDRDSTSSLKNKNVEIKREVLEFSKSNTVKEDELPPLKENSININSAGAEELIRLPGIGSKTAENIISFREKKGRFTSLKELLEVKGIGEARYNKIKKFLYIE